MTTKSHAKIKPSFPQYPFLPISLLYKNEWKEHKFRWQKNRKNWKNKKIFNINDIDVNKIWVSRKEPYGTNNALKYFIGYNDNDAIRPLYSKRSKMTGYINIFNENKNKNKKKIK